MLLTLSKRQILDTSKLKEFADDNSKFDEQGRKFSKRIENTLGKGQPQFHSHEGKKTFEYVAGNKHFPIFTHCFLTYKRQLPQREIITLETLNL